MWISKYFAGLELSFCTKNFNVCLCFIGFSMKSAWRVWKIFDSSFLWNFNAFWNSISTFLVHFCFVFFFFWYHNYLLGNQCDDSDKISSIHRNENDSRKDICTRSMSWHIFYFWTLFSTIILHFSTEYQLFNHKMHFPSFHIKLYKYWPLESFLRFSKNTINKTRTSR